MFIKLTYLIGNQPDRFIGPAKLRSSEVFGVLGSITKWKRLGTVGGRVIQEFICVCEAYTGYASCKL
jgi:hypothetical protein